MRTELKDPQYWRFRAEAVYALIMVVVFCAGLAVGVALGSN